MQAPYTHSQSTHNTLKTLWEHFGSLWAFPTREKHERVEGIYRPKKKWTSSKNGVRLVLLHNGPKAVSYIQVLPRGYSKK